VAVFWNTVSGFVSNQCGVGVFLCKESGIALRAPYIPMDDLTFVSNVVSVNQAAESWYCWLL